MHIHNGKIIRLGGRHETIILNYIKLQKISDYNEDVGNQSFYFEGKSHEKSQEEKKHVALSMNTWSYSVETENMFDD